MAVDIYVGSLYLVMLFLSFCSCSDDEKCTGAKQSLIKPFTRTFRSFISLLFRSFFLSFFLSLFTSVTTNFHFVFRDPRNHLYLPRLHPSIHPPTHLVAQFMKQVSDLSFFMLATDGIHNISNVMVMLQFFA